MILTGKHFGHGNRFNTTKIECIKILLLYFIFNNSQFVVPSHVFKNERIFKEIEAKKSFEID